MRDTIRTLYVICIASTDRELYKHKNNKTKTIETKQAIITLHKENQKQNNKIQKTKLKELIRFAQTNAKLKLK